MLAVQFGGAPFHGANAVLGDETVGQEFAQTLQFLGQKSLLFEVRAHLTTQAADLFGMLAHPLAQDGAFGLDGIPPRLQQSLLALKGLATQSLICFGIGGELDRFGQAGQAVTFGDQAGATRQKGDHLAGQAAFGGDQFGRGDPQQGLTDPNRLALAYIDVGDDAAVAMLDHLPVARHRDHALGHGAGVERSEGGPAQEADKEGPRHDQADTSFPMGCVQVVVVRADAGAFAGGSGHVPTSASWRQHWRSRGRLRGRLALQPGVPDVRSRPGPEPPGDRHFAG
ncbi:hypothetical protein D3C80_1171140 [compost metagenome]